jgi:hypothetical protein
MATLLISHQFADYYNIPGMRRVVKTETDIADFSVIKIEEASRLQIVPSDTNRLDYDALIGDGIDPPKTEPIQDFIVENDTLFIKNLRNAKNGGYTLRVSKLKHLIVKNTGDVELLGFSQDSLKITVEETNTLWVNNSKISYMHFVSPEKFDLELISTDDLRLALFGDKNLCSVGGNIQSVSGKIGNYMKLSVPRKTEILDVDKSDNGKISYSTTIYVD